MSERDQHGEGQHLPAEPEVEGVGVEERRPQRPQQVLAEPRDQQPGPAGEQAEERALGEQLADEPSAARPERDADRDLAAPAGGAGEQQVRHVRAGDEQDEGHHAHEHGPGQGHVPAKLRIEAGHGSERRAAGVVLLRMGLLEPGRDRAQGGVGLPRP